MVKDRTSQTRRSHVALVPDAKPQARPVQGRRVDVQPALSEDLLERVLDLQNLKRAWKQVRANGGAPGVDAMTLTEFPDFVHAKWASLRQSLTGGTYCPQPVRQRMIPKPSGGERALGIPTVLDRVTKAGHRPSAHADL